MVALEASSEAAPVAVFLKLVVPAVAPLLQGLQAWAWAAVSLQTVGLPEDVARHGLPAVEPTEEQELQAWAWAAVSLQTVELPEDMARHGLPAVEPTEEQEEPGQPARDAWGASVWALLLSRSAQHWEDDILPAARAFSFLPFSHHTPSYQR